MKKIVVEYLEKSIEHLEKEVATLQSTILKMSVDNFSNPQKDTNAIRKMQKKRAVLLTMITEKKIRNSK